MHPSVRTRNCLPYLVRRLLENGANTSFVNRIVDADTAVDEIIRDPVSVVDGLETEGTSAHCRAARSLRRRASQFTRCESRRSGWTLCALTGGIRQASENRGAPRRSCRASPSEARARRSRIPANRAEVIGTITWPLRLNVTAAIDAAVVAQPAGTPRAAGERAAILRARRTCSRIACRSWLPTVFAKAGRSIPDSIAEVREAVDFLRYYAVACACRVRALAFRCPVRRVRATNCACRVAASSSASAHGISRSPSSPGRLRPRWLPAMR